MALIARDPNDSKATLQHYLQGARDALLWKVEGLSDRDLLLPRTPTGVSLIGLVKHAATTEIWYFGDTFGRAWPTPDRVTDADVDADPQADWHLTDVETCAGIVDLHRRVQAFADATIADLSLDATGHVPWWGDQGNVTLHTVLVHVIADLTRHAGHADILREQLDGSAGLNPRVANLPDGQDWPAYVRALEERAERS